ncbi:helix-turn-helix domain-containing protein [Henriciella aquimarina]|uniref:helix-turn-helix domain-containing protein n=1 Tax=Henriciella aquimarina TaxID=545261 RepID=UPI000A070768|nr:helix-turn-helix domain-containing protein [Henriciella aquimarina]
MQERHDGRLQPRHAGTGSNGKNGACLQRLQPRETLFIDGERAHSVFRVRSGLVMTYRLLSDGRRQIHSFARTGDFLTLGTGDLYTVSAEAITESSVEVFRRGKLDNILREDSVFGRQLIQRLTHELSVAREQAAMLGRKSAMERIASFLVFLDRRGDRTPDELIAIPMTRNDIADYLGLTLETVSRMIHRLKALGLIDLPRPDRFRVLCPPELAEAAGEGLWQPRLDSDQGEPDWEFH